MAYARSGTYESDNHNPNQNHLDHKEIDNQAIKAHIIFAL